LGSQKRRIDLLLVELGIAESRHKAQGLLLAGQIMVDGQKVEKTGHLVRPDAEIRVLGRERFVSRAGAKLQAALEAFPIAVSGRVCVDLGASTGGFTDCLLQNGAAVVHSFDVGKGQLDWKLRSDPRVIVHDEFNVRYLAACDLPDGVSLVCGDLSFISLTKILLPVRDALLGKMRLESGAGAAAPVDLVLLVKPQFEVGKGEVGKGGIVRDAGKRTAAVEAVAHFARESGFAPQGWIASPVAGSKGNQEFLLYLQLSSDLSSPA
jgi:23S rRNA (cytidine1920-2'-O)/16S rRNA (cytidine1409-2'-O)-methyltransferase